MLHKKQAYNLIEDICKLNEEAWNNKRGDFDVSNGAAMIIEEALELAGSGNPREESRSIVKEFGGEKMLRKVDELDALVDVLYITIGELHKIGLEPEKIVDALQIVHNANKQKSGMKDENGKVIKPDDFVGPEEKLQQLLKG